MLSEMKSLIIFLKCILNISIIYVLAELFALTLYQHFRFCYVPSQILVFDGRPARLRWFGWCGIGDSGLSCLCSAKLITATLFSDIFRAL